MRVAASVRGFIVNVSLLLAACSGSLTSGGSGESSDGNAADGGKDTTTSTTVANTGTADGGSGTSGGTGSGGAGPEGFVASESVARRLSRAELDNTLSTLLLDDQSRARQLLSEDEHSPYDNDYTLQLASAALIDSLESLGTDSAARAIHNEAFRSSLPCTPSDDEEAACFQSIAEYLLTRGFRRAVSDDEVAPYLKLLDFASEEVPGRSIDFYTAVELLIRSIVQDPEFLYRIEVGAPTRTAGVVHLDDFEVASRMSYLLWGDMPDEDLFEQARSGSLLETDTRRASAERMFEDPRAREQLQRFHAMWLGYRTIPHPAELASAFARETNRLLDRVLFDEPQDYLNLFTMSETYLDDALAGHYGLPTPGGEDWVSYGDSGRRGILSHGSVLSAFSKFSDTSPTQRGILIRTRLMCDTVNPPPADINTDEPPSAEDADCKVERYEQHRSSAACANCHNDLDPIGFGLENYDMAGRWRDHDDGNDACSIEGVGSVEPYGEFSGPGELAQILVDQGEIDDCVMRQYLSFALGRALQPAEAELAEELISSLRSGDRQLPRVLVDYVASDAFVLKLSPPEP